MAKIQEAESTDGGGPNTNGVTSGGGDANSTQHNSMNGASVGSVQKSKSQINYNKTERMDVDLLNNDTVVRDETMPSRIDFKNGQQRLFTLMEIIEQIDGQNVNFKIRREFNLEIIRSLLVLEAPSGVDELRFLKQGMEFIKEYLRAYLQPTDFQACLCLVFDTLFNQDGTSSAICVFLDLFDENMINEAVNNLMDQSVGDKAHKKVVSLMCKWLIVCNFCSNLHTWIVTVLRELLKAQRHDLHYEIVDENISYLLNRLIYPALRDRITPVVRHMLIFTYESTIFIKVCKVMPDVLDKIIKNPSGEVLKCAQDFVDVAFALAKRYENEDFNIEQLMVPFKCFQPTPAYSQLIYAQIESSPEENFVQNFSNCRVGLYNSGNTCYMNSVLQALAMTKVFSREILLADTSSSMIVKMQEQIALMLFSQRSALTPILDIKPPPGFIEGQQQDSSEFLIHLLEELHVHEQKSRAARERHKNMLAAAAAAAAGAVATEAAATTSKYIMSASAANTAVAKSFTGKLATIYKCLTCQFESRNVDSFRELQLSFRESEIDGSNYSVQDLIEYYCSPEKLNGENKYFCERCKKLTDGERYLTVITAPKNLILTLKQFKYDQKCHRRAKLMHKVYHDEKVSVKLCASDSSEEIGTVCYDLYAGIVHCGSTMDSGHYYTYAADEINKWYKFDDSLVTEANIEDLHNLVPPNTPYILFYQMSEHTEKFASPQCTDIVEANAPKKLKICDLPFYLQNCVKCDNESFQRELIELQRNKMKQQMGSLARNRFRDRRNEDDDDDDSPRPMGGCHPRSDLSTNPFVS